MAKMAIQFNATLTLKEGQPVPHVNYPPWLTFDEIARLGKRTIRDLLHSEALVTEWASDTKKASAQSLLTIDDGLDSKSNQEALKREMSELIAGYSSFAGFETSFHSAYGYRMEDFTKVCECLESLARPYTHTVYRGFKYRRPQQV